LLVRCHSVIPLSIIGAHRFYETLINFLGLISYWASCFIAVLLTEHFFFRTPTIPSPSSPSSKPTRFAAYDLSDWNVPSRLPSGIPAILASLLSFGLVVPCMEQVWFEGPIARTTGDIGFEVALVLTTVFYVPLRWWEVRLRGRV
jgi:purine-cytosine permease-like protein